MLAKRLLNLFTRPSSRISCSPDPCKVRQKVCDTAFSSRPAVSVPPKTLSGSCVPYALEVLWCCCHPRVTGSDECGQLEGHVVASQSALQHLATCQLHLLMCAEGAGVPSLH